MQIIPANQVHVWLCFNDRVDDAQLQHWRTVLLNSEERTRELRFHFERDRKQFVITRALVRTVLSRYADVAPAAWQFVAGPHGRPEIVQRDADHVSFNLSHTAGLVALAISSQQALGVDVENIAIRPAPLDVADHYFSPSEAQALRALPQEAQHERFFHYWTLKEAYIKAKSKGLSLPLGKFSMDMHRPGEVTIGFSDGIEPDPRHWQMFLLQASPEHVLSVCVQQPQPVALSLRHIRPGVDEAPHPAPVLRQTVLA